ncbi:hypothetical protein [Streptomyces sp. NPDC006285]|uniref:hypothetical protein n=1 Tax=Streptomyces sp. NPDC006285 TaxID=3364742 RepID=UPI00369E43E4
MPTDNADRRERKRKLDRERQQQLRSDPAYQQRERKRERERRSNPAYQERHRQRMQQLRSDPAYQERERKQQREYWSDPAHQERQRQRRSDPAYREQHRQRMEQLRSDPAYRGRELERQRRRDQRVAAESEPGSLMPEIVALEVYRSYQERSSGWPEVPPTGLYVAVNGRSAGEEGREAVVVRLDVPGAQGLAGGAVPTWLADPSLDLADAGVRSRIFAAGADEGIYRAAESAQGALLDVLRTEEFGADAAFPLGQGRDEEQYDYDDDYEYEYGREPAELFGGVDVDDLVRSGADLGIGIGGGMTEGYGSVVNPVGSYAASYLPAGTYGGVPAQGADSLSQAMGAFAVSAPALPAASTYAPARQYPNVVYSQWDTSAFQPSGVQPAARDRSPSTGSARGR